MRRWRSYCSVEGAVLLTLLFVVSWAILCQIATLWPHHWPWDAAFARERIRAELPLAEERWARNGVLDYDVDYWAFAHNSSCATFLYREREDGSVTIQVRGGELVLTEVTQKLVENCGLLRDLPPAVFQSFAKALERPPPIRGSYLWQVTFDPNYGFVTHYSTTSEIRLTLSSYRLTNFRPVPPGTPPSP